MSFVMSPKLSSIETSHTQKTISVSGYFKQNVFCHKQTRRYGKIFNVINDFVILLNQKQNLLLVMGMRRKRNTIKLRLPLILKVWCSKRNKNSFQFLDTCGIKIWLSEIMTCHFMCVIIFMFSETAYYNIYDEK